MLKWIKIFYNYYYYYFSTIIYHDILFMDLYYRKQIKKNNKKIPHLSNVKNQVFDSILMDDCYKTFFFFFCSYDENDSILRKKVNENPGEIPLFLSLQYIKF